MEANLPTGPPGSSCHEVCFLGRGARAPGFSRAAPRGARRSRSYKDVPMQLADGQGRLTMDLQTTASYLILHVHSAGSPPQEDSRTDAQRAALGGIARHASATCTPRGLVNKVSQGSAGESSSQLDYAVFVWHGMGVDPLIK
ncbi:unnamed protein product, partial [Prorocentrum cordatum]